MSDYSFEYHDEDATAFVTFDNGKQVSICFLDNRIAIKPLEDTQLSTDELPGELLVDVS